MFTGLVEAKGELMGMQKSLQGHRMELDLGRLAEGLEHGASVAVAGVCLSVVGLEGSVASFDVSQETIEKTWFSVAPIGKTLNVELSLKADGRLGGHFVTGHVDGIGSLLSREEQGEFAVFTFQASSDVGPLLIPKGSVTIDGVSLTVARLLPNNQFTVALIPETLSTTTLGSNQVGDLLHMEGDLLGKYVFRFLEQSRAN